MDRVRRSRRATPRAAACARASSVIGVVRTGDGIALAAVLPGDARPQPRPGDAPDRHRSSSQAGSYPARRAGRISVSQAPAGASKPSSCADHRVERVRPLHARVRRDALPAQQEAQEVARRDRLDLRAQALDGVAVDARQQPALAPFVGRRLRA